MIQRLLFTGILIVAALPAQAADAPEGTLSPFAGDVGNAIWRASAR